MTEPAAQLTEDEVDEKALRLQALCYLVAFMNVERGDRIGFWSREIMAYFGGDADVVSEARRISFKEGH